MLWIYSNTIVYVKLLKDKVSASLRNVLPLQLASSLLNIVFDWDHFCFVLLTFAIPYTTHAMLSSAQKMNRVD